MYDFSDPLEMNFPMVHKPVFFYGPERKGAPEWLVKAEQKVKEADAYVIVSAEYNHAIPPALSNMMDHFGGSCYAYKPSAIVCYSAGNTQRLILRSTNKHSRPYIPTLSANIKNYLYKL